MPVTMNDFRSDEQGKRFSDVLEAPVQFDALDDFLTLAQDHLDRLFGSELHHDRPPLAGVVREYEARPAFQRAVKGRSREDIRVKRLKQAVGAACRLIMESHGWTKTTEDGSLRGLSEWFSRARRYTPPPAQRKRGA